jgi:hypothetical protein
MECDAIKRSEQELDSVRNISWDKWDKDIRDTYIGQISEKAGETQHCQELDVFGNERKHDEPPTPNPKMLVWKLQSSWLRSTNLGWRKN